MNNTDSRKASSHRTASAAALLLTVLLLGACGSGSETSLSAEQPVTTSDSELTVRADGAVGSSNENLPGAGEVKLWVSNQSFAEPNVTLDIRVDNQTVVDEQFAVENQHNTIGYILANVEPATEHTITATADSGAEASAVFTVDTDQPLWISLAYWGGGEDSEEPDFTLEVADEPFYFD